MITDKCIAKVSKELRTTHHTELTLYPSICSSAIVVNLPLRKIGFKK